MPNERPTNGFDKSDEQYFNEHLHAVARRFVRVAGDDPRIAFPQVQSLMQRLGMVLLLECNTDLAFVDVMSIVGQAAGANVLAEIREQVNTGQPDWVQIGRALGMSPGDARSMFTKDAPKD